MIADVGHLATVTAGTLITKKLEPRYYLTFDKPNYLAYYRIDRRIRPGEIFEWQIDSALNVHDRFIAVNSR